MAFKDYAKEINEAADRDAYGPSDVTEAEDRATLYANNWQVIEFVLNSFGENSSKILYINRDRIKTRIAEDCIAERHGLVPGADDYQVDYVDDASIATSPVTRFAVAEKALRSCGYFYNQEFRNAGVGGKLHDIAFYRRNRAATYLQFANMVSMFPGVTTGKTPNLPKEVNRAVAAWIGDLVGVQLIKAGDLYRPSKKLVGGQRIIEAHQSSVTEAIAEGRTDEFGLIAARTEDVLNQVRAELALSGDLFGVSATGLYLWQTQVLANLRRATQWTKFRHGNEFENYKKKLLAVTRKAAAANRRAWKAGAPLLRLTESALHEAAVAELIIGHQNEDNTPRDFDFGFEFGGVAGTLSLEEAAIAALHGVIFEPTVPFDEHGCADEPHFTLLHLMAWLGRLKRNRHESLDTWLAAIIVAAFDDRTVEDEDRGEGDEFRSQLGAIEFHRGLLEAHLAPSVWDVLVGISRNIVAGHMTRYDIAYEWVTDPRDLWRVEQRDCGTVIRGPLLDFPLGAGAHWTDLAREIAGADADPNDLTAFSRATILL